MRAPRITPATRKDIGLVGWTFAHAAGLVTRTGPPNLFLTLGRHRRLFWGWLGFARRLMPGGLLPRRETELVILRTAHLRDCDYEIDHHRRLARRSGLQPADLDRVAVGPDVPGWTDREETLLRAVDALHHQADLDDDQWSDLRRHLDEREAIELCLLTAHYQMLATAITALRIPPDSPRTHSFV